MEFEEKTSSGIGVIYQIKNKVNSKSYIGYTSKGSLKRFQQHVAGASRKNNKILSRAIMKYGKENFEVIELCCSKDLDVALNILEPLMISYHKPEYNSTAGGDGILGYHHTKKTRKHISKIQLGRKLSQEHKVNISLGNIGKKNTETHIVKVKKAFGKPTHLDDKIFVSANDAALYALQTYGMSRNTALRKLRKGISDFSLFVGKYNKKPKYTAKRLEKWHTLQS